MAVDIFLKLGAMSKANLSTAAWDIAANTEAKVNVEPSVTAG
jgi:hypothetical protein